MKKEQKQRVLKTLQGYNAEAVAMLEKIESGILNPAQEEHKKINAGIEENTAQQLTHIEKMELFKKDKEKYLNDLKQREEEGKVWALSKNINEVALKYAHKLSGAVAEVVAYKFIELLANECETTRDRSDLLGLAKYENAKNNRLNFYISYYDSELYICFYGAQAWNDRTKASVYIVSGSGLRQLLTGDLIYVNKEELFEDCQRVELWKNQKEELLKSACYNYNDLKNNIDDLRKTKAEQKSAINEINKKYENIKNNKNIYGVLTFVNDIFN